jgi:hypothetical protein
MPDKIQTIPGAPGVIIVDVSETIAGFIARTRTKVPKLRDVSKLERLYIHHSGSRGADGAKGAINSARYYLLQKKWRPKSKPMPPYHIWIPETGGPDGQVVMYQMAPIEWMCWHTGGLNRTGIGVACQGNKTSTPLTYNQEEGLEAIVAHLYHTELEPRGVGWHDDWLGGHWEVGRWGGDSKRSCPGKHTKRWLINYRDNVKSIARDEVEW